MGARRTTSSPSFTSFPFLLKQLRGESSPNSASRDMETQCWATMLAVLLIQWSPAGLCCDQASGGSVCRHWAFRGCPRGKAFKLALLFLGFSVKDEGDPSSSELEEQEPVLGVSPSRPTGYINSSTMAHVCCVLTWLSRAASEILAVLDMQCLGGPWNCPPPPWATLWLEHVVRA